MRHSFTFKDSDQEAYLIRGRIIFAGVAATVLILVILFRIFTLQVIQHDHFTTLSQSNRVKIVPIPPTRGLIFSRDNVLLADNRSSFSLELTPENIPDVNKTIARLRKIIPVDDDSVKRFRQQLGKSRRFESIPLRFNLSDEEVARISVNLYRFPGVDVKARLNRYYPLGENFAHTIGYVGMIDEDELSQVDQSNYSATSHIGKIGVEKAYEDLLHGQVGYQQVEVNAQGRTVRVLDRTPPVPGKNLYLTIDVTLQNLAAKEMENKRGAVVALDPRDGDILAMVSSPSYDPNLFVNGIDTKTYNALLSSEDTPLLNRALRGKYPPGSTVKPFLAFSALQAGLREPGDETWCPGWYKLKGSSHEYRDWKHGGHGHTNMHDAIAQSCDVYFYDLANDMGIDQLHDSLAQFGFGDTTGLDIGGESAGLLPSRKWKRQTQGQPWYPGETLITGIGQGSMLVTPLQLAVATATMANRGRVLKPHLFKMARDPRTNQVVARSRRQVTRVIQDTDSSDWEHVINAMHDVVQGPHGTARREGRGADYEFAGKTGTAQVVSLSHDNEGEAEDLPEELQDHALFIAFAPLQSPTIALAVIVENGGGGSSTAAPIARKLLDIYLDKTAAEVKDKG